VLRLGPRSPQTSVKYFASVYTYCRNMYNPQVRAKSACGPQEKSCRGRHITKHSTVSSSSSSFICSKKRHAVTNPECNTRV